MALRSCMRKQGCVSFITRKPCFSMQQKHRFLMSVEGVSAVVDLQL